MCNEADSRLMLAFVNEWWTLIGVRRERKGGREKERGREGEGEGEGERRRGGGREKARLQFIIIEST